MGIISLIWSIAGPIIKLLLPMLLEASHDKATHADIDEDMAVRIDSRIERARSAGLLPPRSFYQAGNPSDNSTG